jgi:hypothetical protein
MHWNEAIHQSIIQTVEKLQPNVGRNRGVTPLQVSFHVFYCERNVRRYMVELSEQNKLVRMGERKGYRVLH